MSFRLMSQALSVFTYGASYLDSPTKNNPPKLIPTRGLAWDGMGRPHSWFPVGKAIWDGNRREFHPKSGPGPPVPMPSLRL